MPGDLNRSITIAVGIIDGAVKGEGLADVRCALDQEGSITIIDERNWEVVGIDRLSESLCIGVGDVCSDAVTFKGFGDDEGRVGAEFPPIDAIERGLPGDLNRSITIAVGIIDGAVKGEGLADVRCALDQEGSITIIDVWNIG